MRTFGKLTLALGMVAMMGATSWAQGRGGFGGGGGAMLLTNKGVQSELKVTDEQAEKLTAFAAKQREAAMGLRDLSPEERREKMAEMNKTMMVGLKEILKPGQVKRFEQIQMHQAGAAAFAMPKVQDELKLTDDQKSKIREINEAMAAEMGEARQMMQDDREGAMKKMAEARKSSHEKAAAVLTSEQKTTWKELAGDPYEVKMEPRN